MKCVVIGIGHHHLGPIAAELAMHANLPKAALIVDDTHMPPSRPLPPSEIFQPFDQVIQIKIHPDTFRQSRQPKFKHGWL